MTTKEFQALNEAIEEILGAIPFDLDESLSPTDGVVILAVAIHHPPHALRNNNRLVLQVAIELQRHASTARHHITVMP